MPKGIKGFQKKELNPTWKGEDVKYAGLHSWVKSNIEKSVCCQRCERIKRLDLANISGEYKRDLNDWEWLCRKCHMLGDGRREKVIYRNKTIKHKKPIFSDETKSLFKDIAKKRLRDNLGHFIRNNISTEY